MQTLNLNHNQVKYLQSVIEVRLHTLDIFLEPDMKSGFSNADVLSMQNEKIELHNVLKQLTEG